MDEARGSLSEHNMMVMAAAERFAPQRAAKRQANEADVAKRERLRLEERLGWLRGVATVSNTPNWSTAQRVMMIASDILRLDAGEDEGVLVPRLKALAPEALEAITTGGDADRAYALSYARGISHAFREIEKLMDEREGT